MPDRRLPPLQAVSTVPSPCVRNCCLDDNDICLGCFRSLEEITSWGQSDDTQRHAIVRRARRRQRQHD
ncbi:DUF1289 domain-containing protein [Pseudomonadota bacterium]